VKGAGAAILLLIGAVVTAGCADPARERFERAEKALLEQRMEVALAGFRSIPREFPQSRYAPAALLRQGELYGDFYRNFPAALEAYDSLVFNYPRAAEAPRALLRRGEIHLLHFLDHASAVRSFEAIQRDFPRFAGMDEALLLLGQAYGGMPDPARQIAVLTDLVGRFPGTSRAGEGRWMLANALMAQGRFQEADREFRKLFHLASDGKTAARARWGMAQALEGSGQLSAALEQYEAMRGDAEDPAHLAEKISRLKKRMKES
jgi:TolA-binding protein